MDRNNFDRARVLSEALPYIQKYYKKTVVIKYGGAAMTESGLKLEVMKDIVLLSLVGISVVIVHGGGPEINALLKKTGKEARFINGLRYTDEETMDIVQMVLCGKIGKDLVSQISSLGGRGLSLCGLDADLMKAERLVGENGEDYGFVGNIKTVDPSSVITALENGYIPVVSTVARGIDGAEAYNINADTAAAKLAAAMGAEKLILLTDVRGLLRDPGDENTLINQVNLHEVPKLVKDGIITKGMIPKVECCVEAVRQGVRRAHILDGRIPHSILIEMLSDEGIGTMIM